MFHSQISMRTFIGLRKAMKKPWVLSTICMVWRLLE